MKHVKAYEKEDKTSENIELLGDLLKENPLSKDNDFYMFIAGSKFIETDNGLYKKKLDIENMVRITPDANGLSAMNFLPMRARFQTDCKLYHIWLPIELRDQIEGKGSAKLDEYLIELIDKYKQTGSDQQGRKVMSDVIQRRKDIEKFNL